MRHAVPSTGYEIEENDLFHTSYSVIGTRFEVVRTPKGWRARPKPKYRERTAWLTKPTEAAPTAVVYLIRWNYLPRDPRDLPTFKERPLR